MNAMPASILHRVNMSLNWSRADGLPTDGDVTKRTVGDRRIFILRAQPRGQGSPRGVSLFEPDPAVLPAINKFLGAEAVGCFVTIPNSPLPPFMNLVNDMTLELKLYDDNTMVCGQHWTLYANVDVEASQFEAAFQQLLASAFVPCSVQGGAEATDLDVDMDDMPGDKLTRAAVMALDHLAEHTNSLNVKLFAHVYALHMRAKDMAFGDVLKSGPMANMLAAALEGWTVRDPLLWVDAGHVRDHLAQVLEMEVPGPKYMPFWVSVEA